MEFEWAPDKAAENLRKHGVSCDEATTVFGDPLSVTAADPDHSLEEQRFIIVGQSSQGTALMVAHEERRGRIRVLSARKLTRQEREVYEEISG